uniref:Uncharacterized protein n=1 Tax=Octopus bimaculoides TaxID=37653 RepID=A0A0L8HAY3_OCTBM
MGLRIQITPGINYKQTINTDFMMLMFNFLLTDTTSHSRLQSLFVKHSSHESQIYDIGLYPFSRLLF